MFRECVDVYTPYSENHKFITVQEFQSFLVQEQQDPMGNDEREVSHFMRDYLQDSQRNVQEPYFTTIEVWACNCSSDVCRLKFNKSGYTSIAVDQKHLESFVMWWWGRMEKISWTNHVRNKEVLLGVNEQRNILHKISKRKANWIGRILRRNCPLQQVIEGKLKGGNRSVRKTRKKT